MAKDIFLKLDDIAGESRDAKHTGEIEVNHMRWEMVQSATAHMGRSWKSKGRRYRTDL